MNTLAELMMKHNLTPNPFPRGKGNKICGAESPFSFGLELRVCEFAGGGATVNRN
jgi:hypothetical protein